MSELSAGLQGGHPITRGAQAVEVIRGGGEVVTPGARWVAAGFALFTDRRLSPAQFTFPTLRAVSA